MFDPSDQPRFFGVAPGVDFPRVLVKGLRDRLNDAPPQAMGRVHLYVNTRRMARRIRAIFDAGPPGLLPRIRLITDLAHDPVALHIPAAVPPLRRRLELVQLLSGLLTAQPDLAPRSSLFDLADSLIKLMDEMHGEGVAPDRIRALDIADQSGHWDRALTFIGIVQDFFAKADAAPDTEARQRRVIQELGKLWLESPPDHPIIVAGSTGSRGATALFMQQVARLPQGAVILPGFDYDMPAAGWNDLADAMTAEDHPQFRFHKLLTTAGLSPETVPRWSDDPPANAARNQLVSLALRPAPVTDQWLRDGPALRDIDRACADLTLLEAETPRAEALAIALRLRKAAETGETAALITPDRLLTRQVTAALQRWGITPDDSAGIPLQLTPVGRLLRHVGGLIGQRLTAEALLTLLKHPLTHAGGQGRLFTQKLEVALRKYGPPFPTRPALLDWADRQDDPKAARDWVTWIFDAIAPLSTLFQQDMTDFLSAHIACAEQLSAGPDGQTLPLWDKDAGAEARRIVDSLRAEAHLAGTLTAQDYVNLFNAILATGEVRNSDIVHPHILIWGTLEARVQGADLLILAGLNEGVWPERPDPDPWMNRKMRQDAGLLLPERRIGLAAHDFQQAIAAPKVWLTRAAKSDDAETVPSRWINRLTNLLGGLTDQGGATALDQMRANGQHWLAKARALETPTKVDPAPRPAPRPPVAARPRQLSVTAIKTLIRDPYAIYARHILGLQPLDPLSQDPSAATRGTLIHDALHSFIDAWQDGTLTQAKQRLLEITDTILAEHAPWPATRVIWQAKVERVADWFIQTEFDRRKTLARSFLETSGELRIPELAFRLTGKADRIDQDIDGRLHIYDYKTGDPPSKKVQQTFDLQLLLEVVMAEQGAFQDVPAAPVADAAFIGLNATPKLVPAPLKESPPDVTLTQLKTLLTRYFDPQKGYMARRAMQKERDVGRYDHLARYGEWDISSPACPEDLT